MIITKNIVLKRLSKKPIVIDTFYSESKTSQPVVLFCHGYKGFKDWGAWDLMAKHIAKAGFCFVKFNFSHNGGTVDDPIDFPDLEAFGNNNYTKELSDLGDIIDWTKTHFKANKAVNTSEIYLIGHSRGGGISILKTAEDSRIKKLVCLASVSDFGSRFGNADDILNWKKQGVKYITNGRTKQQMPHYYQFYKDFVTNEKQLNIKTAVKNISVPFLIIHGDADTSVKIDEALALHQWQNKSELEIIKAADHVFNTKHPWEKDVLSDELQAVSELIAGFFKTKKLQN